MILIACLCHSVSNASAPIVFDRVYYGQNIAFSKDVVVTENALIDVVNIQINDSLRFNNRGTINGDFHVCDNCQFAIRNSGYMNGVIYGGNNSEIIQLISSSDDINRLNVNGSRFSILVNNTEAVNLSDVLRISAGADRVILNNAHLVLSSDHTFMFRSINTDPEIELVGEVFLRIENLKKMNGALLMENVTGDAIVNIISPDLDRLYVASTYKENGNLYLCINRETDYTKLFDIHMGAFLNDLRNMDPDNPTLNAIDTADSMTDIEDILSKSVVTNPINLMKPIKILNLTEINSVPAKHDFAPDGFGTMYLSSDELSMLVGKAHMTRKFEDTEFNISAYVGSFEISENINQYSGVVYGGNVRARTDLGSVAVNSLIGFTGASFETDFLFDGTGITTNPNGLSVYGAIDLGKTFDFDDNYYLSPFVGLVGEFDKVLHQSDTDMAVRAGFTAGTSTEMGGIRNSYQIIIVGQTNNFIEIGLGINFWSVIDQAGVGFNYSVIRDGAITTHKIAANIKYLF